jgi:hypothetical protein
MGLTLLFLAHLNWFYEEGIGIPECEHDTLMNYWVLSPKERENLITLFHNGFKFRNRNQDWWEE